MKQYFHIQRSFNRAAKNYYKVADLPNQIAAELLERLDLVTVQPVDILDLGAGIGWTTQALADKYPEARIVSLDCAVAMLQQGKQRRLPVVGYAQALPFVHDAFDLVFSDLLLHWCDNVAGVFAELSRLLRPKGLMLFSSLGPNTLHELHDSWQQVNPHPWVNEFVDMHDIGDSLVRCGFQDVVMDTEQVIVRYPNVKALLTDLKSLGSTRLSMGKKQPWIRRTMLDHLETTYQTRYADAGKIPATFTVVYGCARWPEQQRHAGSNEIRVPISDILNSR